MQKNSKNKKYINYNFIPILIAILAIMSYIINNKSITVFIIEIFSLLIINIYYIFLTKKEKNMIQPITIINILTIFMFCVRPLFIILNDYDYIKNISSSFRYYSMINGITSITSYPNCKTLLIIIIASLTLNLSYFKFNRVEILKVKEFDYAKTKLNRDGIIISLLLISVFALFFFIKYDYHFLLVNAGKLSVIGVDFEFYETLWMYIFPFVIGYCYMNSLGKGKKPILAIILFLIDIFLLMALSRRSYAINILIILFLITIFQKEKIKINIKKIIAYILILVTVVLGFAGIRDVNIGKSTSNSIFVETVNEFDMYDMFVISVDYYEKHQNNYNGINYLAFPFIPNIIWQNKPKYFDIYNSEIVLGGYYSAGIPTSFYGSTYLNFGIIGMIGLMVILGIVFRKVYLKLFPLKNVKSIFTYSVFFMFIYDFFRVGDFARELWSFMLYFFCMIVCNFLIYKGEEKNEH